MKMAEKMDEKKYWLGPGSLQNQSGLKAIMPRKEIPPAVLKIMGEKRVEIYIKAGKISDASQETHVRTIREIQKAYQMSEKDNKSALKKIKTLKALLKKSDAANEKLQAENDDLEKINLEHVKLKKAFKAAEKEQSEKSETAKDKLQSLEKALTAAEQNEAKLLKKIEKLKEKLKKKEAKNG